MSFAHNDGVKIGYEVEGEGPPLVLMHGAFGTREVWRRNGVVDALKSKYLLILVDARGHGESDKPHQPSAYLPEPKAKDVTAVLDQLAIESAHYLGYSMGGRFGFDLCTVAPERMRSLVAGGAGPSPTPMYGAWRMFSENSLEDLLKIGFLRIPEEGRREFLANDIEALRASLHPSILDQEDVYTAALIEFPKPALLFAGSEDPRHDDARAIVARMTNAEFLSLDGLDHLGAFLAIDRFLPRVTKFLDEVEHGSRVT